MVNLVLPTIGCVKASAHIYFTLVCDMIRVARTRISAQIQTQCTGRSILVLKCFAWADIADISRHIGLPQGISMGANKCVKA